MLVVDDAALAEKGNPTPSCYGYRKRYERQDGTHAQVCVGIYVACQEDVWERRLARLYDAMTAQSAQVKTTSRQVAELVDLAKKKSAEKKEEKTEKKEGYDLYGGRKEGRGTSVARRFSPGRLSRLPALGASPRGGAITITLHAGVISI